MVVVVVAFPNAQKDLGRIEFGDRQTTVYLFLSKLEVDIIAAIHVIERPRPPLPPVRPNPHPTMHLHLSFIRVLSALE